jgi:hypothetical protein
MLFARKRKEQPQSKDLALSPVILRRLFFARLKLALSDPELIGESNGVVQRRS